MSDEKFMRLAIEEAALCAEGEVPVGAVLVIDGKIVARGHNTAHEEGDATAHAEMNALRALGTERASEATLYVTMEPCPMCAGAMLVARVKRLVYGTPSQYYGAAGSVVDLFGLDGFHHRCAVTGGVLADECAALLKDCFEQRRSQNECVVWFSDKVDRVIADTYMRLLEGAGVTAREGEPEEARFLFGGEDTPRGRGISIKGLSGEAYADGCLLYKRSFDRTPVGLDALGNSDAVEKQKWAARADKGRNK